MLQTNQLAGEGHFSPDGKWITFVEMDAEDFGVYVRPAAGGEKQRVSVGGRISPRWRRDGRELIYQFMDSFDYWSVPVNPGPTLTFGKPASLFARDTLDFASFDLLPDGKRLVSKVAEPGTQETPPTNVVLNWIQELKKK